MSVPRSAALPLLVPPRTTVVDGVVREASVPALAAPVHDGSLGDLPFVNALADPAAVVLGRRQPDGLWRDVSAARFAAEVLAVAKGLIAHGLRPGDRLALMSRTRCAWTLLDCAAWAAGLVTVPVHPASSAAGVRWVLAGSGATACVVETPAHLRLLGAERAALPGLAHVWQIDAGAVGLLTAAGRGVPDAAVTARRAARTPADIATIAYTAGTTGRPKGCVLTHANFFAAADNLTELLHPVFAPEGRTRAGTLLLLPLAHIPGRVIAVGCLRARVRLGHAPSLRGADLAADLAGFGPTFVAAAPHVLAKVPGIASGQGVRAALGGRVRHVIGGGAPLGGRLAALCADAGVEVLQGYGPTETTGVAALTPPRGARAGTAGRPLPGTAVRIAPDGEVQVRGGHVLAGYWDAARQAVVPATAGRWWATGDLGSLDEDGYLTVTGRREDLIVTADGTRIAPGPLEERLQRHPLVGRCVVVGEGRPYPVALIAPGAGVPVDASLPPRLRAAVAEANRAVPRAGAVRRFAVLPADLTEEDGHLTPSGTVRRAAVAADFAAEIDALYGD
ncbi:AMP-dependent synthetase/ligase [Streptomyces cinnamoneus]|uniref:AMP-dependent synthetase/ligase n=1 Tax=Streptomyces cinnamoneus TaxID=53446 RepID=UPI0033EDF926